jgi:ABC-type transport system involved in multi-copper enzyme maturation permease subunit
MVLLPIVARELVVAARKPSTYRQRAIVAGLGLLFFLFCFSQRGRTTDNGSPIFNELSCVILMGSLLFGVFLTSDSLSSEKREGTLGLLFLTDLKPLDIVLGKMTSSSLNAFYCLLGVLPVLALPTLLGGVTVGEFARMMLVMLVTAFFSLSVGLCVSSFSTDSAKAIATTFLTLILPLAIAHLTLELWGTSSLTIDKLLLPSPFTAMRLASDAHYGAMFWQSVLSMLLLAGVAIGGALFQLKRSLRRNSLDSRESRAKNANRQPFTPIAEGDNPGRWLAARDFSLGGYLKWTMILGCALFFTLLALCFAMKSRNYTDAFFVCALLTALAMHFAVKCLLVAAASRRTLHDLRSGAFELLMATPLSTQDFIAGIQQGIFSRFKRAARWLTVVNGFLIATVLAGKTLLHMNASDQAIFCIVFGGGILLLWVTLPCFTWIAMWFGLTSTKHSSAILKTIACLFGPGWLLWLFIVFFVRSFNNTTGPFILLIWIAGCVVYFLVLCVFCRSGLETHLRKKVSEGLN